MTVVSTRPFVFGGVWGGGEGGESRCEGFPCSCFTRTTENVQYHLPAHTIDMEHPRLQIRSLYCSVFIIENVYRQYMTGDRRTGLNMVEWKALVETRQLQIKPGRTNPHISRARKKKQMKNDLILRTDKPKCSMPLASVRFPHPPLLWATSPKPSPSSKLKAPLSFRIKLKIMKIFQITLLTNTLFIFPFLILANFV